MKIIKRVATVVTLIAGCYANVSAKDPVSGLLFSLPAAAIGSSTTIDAIGLDRFSIQTVYSNGTPALHTLSDGAKATANIRVASVSGLAEAVAQSSITIISNTGISGSGIYITINGKPFREGIEWTAGDKSSNTAIAINNAIDLWPGLIASTATSPSTIVWASATVAGTHANTWSISSSDPSKIYVVGTFTGGVDNASIYVGTVTLTQGTHWTKGATAALTATSIETAMKAHFAVASSTASIGTVYSTMTTTGLNAYRLTTSTPTALVPSSFIFTGGSDPAISIADDTFQKASHGFTTGMRVVISTPAAGAMPTATGLYGGTTYYAIKMTDSLYKLATSTMNAVAGTALDITALNGGSTLSVFPVALTLAGSNGISWMASNDGNNWSALSTTSISTVTYSAAGNQLTDFGTNNYRYIKAVVIPPTAGGIRFDLYINGKRD